MIDKAQETSDEIIDDIMNILTHDQVMKFDWAIDREGFQPLAAMAMIELCKVAYLKTSKEVSDALKTCNAKFEVVHDKVHESRCVVVKVKNVIIASFRGTSTEQEAAADLDIEMIHPGFGPLEFRVHRGFWLHLDHIAYSVLSAIRRLYRAGDVVYITGHSLGGSMAGLMALRMEHPYGFSDASTVPLKGVYTVGQPKFTNWKGAKYCRRLLGKRHIRIVDNVDAIPTEPRWGLVWPMTWHEISGYWHSGKEVFIDSTQHLRINPPWIYKFLSKLIGVERELAQRHLALANDHRLQLYSARFARAINLGQEPAITSAPPDACEGPRCNCNGEKGTPGENGIG